MSRFLILTLSILAACSPGADTGVEPLPVKGTAIDDRADEKSIISITIEAAIADGSVETERLCDIAGTTAVGCWDLDEATGLGAYDDSPYINDGSYRNGVGLTGRCASFDGNNDFVQVADDGAFDIGRADLSISAWVYVENATGVRALVDHRGAGTGGRGYELYLFNGRPGLQLADGGGPTNFNSGAAITANAWHHVAVTVDRDSNTGIQFYVDGAAWGAPLNPTGRSGTIANAGRLTFGRNSIDTSYAYDGYLCRVGIWSSVLDASDVGSIYALGL